MSDQVYAAVSKLDMGMANAYKKALGGKPDTKIDLAGAKAIFQELIDGLTAKGKPAITNEEARALLLLLKYAEFTQDAVDFLANSLVAKTSSKDMVLYEALFEGGAAELLKGGKLDAVAGLLDISILERINFHSPDTGVQYSPYYYFAIKELILAKEIEVYAIHDGGLTNTIFETGAAYRSDIDRLFLFEQQGVITLKALFVHEVTHAIQDWFDIPMPGATSIEADAYIAGALALKAMKVKPTSGGAYEAASKNAVPIVLDGKATLANRDWQAAYRAVKLAVANDPLQGDYASFKDKPGRSEKDLMNKYVDKVKKSMAGTK